MACDILWNKETCGKVFWRAFGIEGGGREGGGGGGGEKEEKREKRGGGEGWRGGKRGGEFP